MRQTQLEMLRGEEYQHPYYWAAFIPSGDWREIGECFTTLALTKPQIERWWEIVCSAYLLVSLHGEQLLKLPPQSNSKFSSHPWWNHKSGWNNILNNLRLILQPFVFFNLIKPWLKVFRVPELYQGFLKLQRIINYFTNSVFSQLDYWDFNFSSAA